LWAKSTYAYDNDSKQTALDGQTQGFDANGNMTSVNPTNLLAYDYENRLVQTSFTEATNTYQYDGAGNRMSANRSGVATRYVLDRNSPLAQVLAETDSGGNVIYYYIYGLGLISRIDTNNNAECYHYDSRGSTIALTDAGGNITEAYVYDPFGRPINGQLSDNRFRYLGRHGVMDEENGLLYIRARYYSTKRGRFITKDPTTGKDGDSQSMNRYIYALNNPVRLIDISGLSAQETSGQTLQLATSDGILSHNLLISPSTGGYSTQVAGSTPAYILVGNSSIPYNLFINAVRSASGALSLQAVEKYLDINSYDIAANLNVSVSGLASATTYAIPLASILYQAGSNLIQDETANPNRSGLEEGARISLDIGAASGAEAIGLAAGTVLEPGLGTVVGGLVGFGIGVAYDTYREPIQQGLSAVGDFFSPNYAY
jgi:RHS repeat-associated protein